MARMTIYHCHLTQKGRGGETQSWAHCTSHQQPEAGIERSNQHLHPQVFPSTRTDGDFIPLQMSKSTGIASIRNTFALLIPMLCSDLCNGATKKVSVKSQSCVGCPGSHRGPRPAMKASIRLAVAGEAQTRLSAFLEKQKKPCWAQGNLLQGILWSGLSLRAGLKDGPFTKARREGVKSWKERNLLLVELCRATG